MTRMTQTGYLAAPDLEEPLQEELTGIVQQHGRLFIAEGPPQKAYWAQNIWPDLQTVPFASISDAAKKLRQLQKLWAFYPHSHIRKGSLIAEQLPYFSPKPLAFPAPLPQAPLGSWMLLDDRTLLASPACSSPFAHGEVHFQETKIPPSRAYLKLWEALLKIGRRPQPGDTCLDIGASPGSWTWALQQLGASVVSTDRAPLAPEIAQLPNVHFLKKDAFSLSPSDLPRLDWLLSDVICYPEKLLAWLRQWLPLETNLVCTLKFQGKTNHSIIRDFAAIPHSAILHLHHNKHELTWFRLSTTG